MEVPSIEYSFAADCTGEALVAQGETCHGATERAFTRETGDTTIVDVGAITCDAGQTMVSVAIRLVTDCTGVEDGTACGSGSDEGACFDESCHVFDCTGHWNRTKCLWVNTVMGGTEPGLCVGGERVIPVGDCTDQADETPCGTANEGFICLDEQCAALGCYGLEDGTTCVKTYMFSTWLNACEAGECVPPEDCTGIADGVSCSIHEDSGICSGETCYAYGCEELEDGTECAYYGDDQLMTGVCMAGECGPEE